MIYSLFSNEIYATIVASTTVMSSGLPPVNDCNKKKSVRFLVKM